MRTFFALVATATLVYCGYVLANATTGGVPLITYLMRTPNMDLYAIGGVGAIVMLAFIAISRPRPRVVSEGRKLDEVQDFIDQNMPWLEKLEQKRGRVQIMIGNLNEMSSRVSLIKSGNMGLAAYVAKVDALLPDVRSGVDSLAREFGEGDVIERADELITSYAAVRERLAAVEKLMGAVPEMATQLKDMKAIVEKLEDDKTGAIAKIEALLNGLDELLDQNDEGRIADIENGSDSYDDSLEDQISAARERLGEVKERLEALLTSRGEIEALATEVRTLGEEIAPRSRPTPVAAQ